MNINWSEDLNVIYKKLEKANLTQLKEELFESQLSGGTGWEIFLAVTNKLKEIKQKRPDVYQLIKEEYNNIFDFGYTNGFLQKKS